MKSILEAAETEVSALKRRTIRSLATEDIEESDCAYITKRLDEILVRVDVIKTRKRDADGDSQ